MASAPVARYTMLIQVVFAVVFATATALWPGARSTWHRTCSWRCSPRLVDPLTLIGSQGMALRVAKNALDASEGDIEDAPSARNPQPPRSLRIQRGVRSRGLCLRGTRPVLQGVSLTCPERSLTALVGPSGSGKTTLTRLVARFWDVSEGSVSIGGVDVRDMRPDELMQQISSCSRTCTCSAEPSRRTCWRGARRNARGGAPRRARRAP
ncbi:MAG: ATP-binding cassette domain-containing protein [Eggerthellaceae bacterium]